MSKAKIELSAFIFVLSSWSLPDHVGYLFYVVFGLAIAIWLASLVKAAHPELFRDVRSDLPETPKVPRAMGGPRSYGPVIHRRIL